MIQITPYIRIMLAIEPVDFRKGIDGMAGICRKMQHTDNNICERAIKMAIMHRKNSLFYKTEHGAYIGDLFMSLIHTCNLSKINPLDYLTELRRNSSAVFKNPQ